MKEFVKENNWLNEVNMGGWGNGYVAIPIGHPLHGKDYHIIEELLPNLDVNGGITFSASADALKWDEIPTGYEGSWVVGFDTLHRWDTREMWSKEKVLEEAKNLKNQLLKYVDV